jgi:hypothetical protein
MVVVGCSTLTRPLCARRRVRRAAGLCEHEQDRREHHDQIQLLLSSEQ